MLATISTAVATYCRILDSVTAGDRHEGHHVTTGRMTGWFLIRRTYDRNGQRHTEPYIYVGQSSGLLYWAENGRNGARLPGGTVVQLVTRAQVAA